MCKRGIFMVAFTWNDLKTLDTDADADSFDTGLQTCFNKKRLPKMLWLSFWSPLIGQWLFIAFPFLFISSLSISHYLVSFVELRFCVVKWYSGFEFFLLIQYFPSFGHWALVVAAKDRFDTIPFRPSASTSGSAIQNSPEFLYAAVYVAKWVGMRNALQVTVCCIMHHTVKAHLNASLYI